MRLDTYLHFDGRCAEAFRFYAKCLRGEIAMMMTYGQSPTPEQTPPALRDRIMHVRLVVGDGVLMGSDAPPELYHAQQGFSVTAMVDTPDEAERVFRELGEGATVRMPMQETFWAQRFGMLVDRFGIPWMVSCNKPM